MKKIILFICCMFLYLPVSYALTYSGCEYSTVARMKSIVSNINISYEYRLSGSLAIFDVTLNNITEDIYFEDVINNKTYYYSDTNDGEITIKGYNISSINYKFYSAKDECYGLLLGRRYQGFPIYNIYYNNSLCEDIREFSLCKKWVESNYPYEKFRQLVYEYRITDDVKEEPDTVEIDKNVLDVLSDVYVKYYYYLFLVIILICLIIISTKRQKDRFDI